MAIVEFVMGNRTEAVDLAYKLWNSSYNEKALSLYEKLSKITEAQNKAIEQITGTEKNTSNTGELIGF